MLVDTHCHLDFPEYDSDRDEVVRRAKESGIDYIINVGSTVENSKRATEIAARYDCVFASVGCHPHDADDCGDDGLGAIEALCEREKVVAVGEIGLDYYRNLSSKENQERVFVWLIELAKRKGLPLIVHTRNAQEDTIRILKDHSVNRAIIHCFSGDEEFLKECLSMGFYISFTCNLTYKKSDQLRAIAKLAPIERICLETDAPYLSCEGSRGKRNEPSSVRTLAQEIAKLKSMSFEEVSQTTTNNAKEFFGLI